MTIRVGDVMRFRPTLVSESPNSRVMYILVTNVFVGPRERICDCLMLFDSYEGHENDFDAGTIVPWPYSYINDAETWQRVL